MGEHSSTEDVKGEITCSGTKVGIYTFTMVSRVDGVHPFSSSLAYSMLQFQQLCDETYSWINEKDQTLSNEDCGRDLPSVQALQRKHVVSRLIGDYKAIMNSQLCNSLRKPYLPLMHRIKVVVPMQCIILFSTHSRHWRES